MNHFRLYLRQASAPVQLLLLLSVTLFTTGLLVYMGRMACEVLYGIDGNQLNTFFTQPESPFAVEALKVIQLFTTLGIFLLPAMVFSQLYSSHPERFLRLTPVPHFLWILSSVVLFVVISPVTDALIWFNNQLSLPGFLAEFEQSIRQSGERTQQLISAFVIMNTWGEFFFNLFLMAVLPAFAEEFLFRGVIQRILIQRTGRIHLSVWVTALAFAMMHNQLFSVLPLMVLGALLGYVKEWSGSLWVSIAGHFANNAMIVFLLFFGGESFQEMGVLEAPDLQWLIPSLVISAIIIRILWNRRHHVDYLTDDPLPEPTQEGM